MGFIRHAKSLFLQSVVVALPATLAIAGAASRAPPSIASTVLVNTVCAQCHEMECSQRMSFSSAGDTAGHIGNYAGPQATTALEELFWLIRYTKTRCDYYAPPVSIPRNGQWSAVDLAPLATPSFTAWFVPLGALSKGTWALNLRFESDQAVSAEIVNRRGLVIQEQIAPGARARLCFAVLDAGIPHFLRLHGRNAIAFSGAALARSGACRSGK